MKKIAKPIIKKTAPATKGNAKPAKVVVPKPYKAKPMKNK